MGNPVPRAPFLNSPPLLPVIDVLLWVSAGKNSNFLNIYGNPGLRNHVGNPAPNSPFLNSPPLFTCDWCPAGVSAGTNSNFLNIYGNPV
jgi:hypothetical protein